MAAVIACCVWVFLLAVVEVTETVEEKISRVQAVLLQDLATFKHRQVIHPVLQQGRWTHTHYIKFTLLILKEIHSSIFVLIHGGL